jgi:hypothetical protein
MVLGFAGAVVLLRSETQAPARSLPWPVRLADPALALFMVGVFQLAPGFPMVVLPWAVGYTVGSFTGYRIRAHGRADARTIWPSLLLVAAAAALWSGMSYSSEGPGLYDFEPDSELGSDVDDGVYIRVGESEDFYYLRRCDTGPLLFARRELVQSVVFVEPGTYERPTGLDVILGRERPEIGIVYKCPADTTPK